MTWLGWVGLGFLCSTVIGLVLAARLYAYNGSLEDDDDA